MKEIVLAGGCFWGIQKVFSSIEGVASTECGYVNGDPSVKPTYELVCREGHGYREAVKVEYDPVVVSLDAMVAAFFYVIDPSWDDGQGRDTGPQYRTGVYWTDPCDEADLERLFAQVRPMYPVFCTECGPLTSWTRAEDEHQGYLARNPGGYCHIPEHKMEEMGMILSASRFFRGRRYRRFLPWLFPCLCLGLPPFPFWGFLGGSGYFLRISATRLSSSSLSLSPANSPWYWSIFAAMRTFPATARAIFPRCQ